MKRNMNQLGEDLRLLSSCPVCGERYQQQCASIIEEQKDLFLIHVQCLKCKSSVVSTMTTGQVGVSSVGLITDLTSEDVAKFRRQDEISSNEVLDLHTFLKDKKFNVLQEIQK